VLIVTVFMVIYLALILIWSEWLARILPTIFYAVTCGLAFTLVSRLRSFSHPNRLCL
jgi:hypothetical protein